MSFIQKYRYLAGMFAVALTVSSTAFAGYYTKEYAEQKMAKSAELSSEQSALTETNKANSAAADWNTRELKNRQGRVRSEQQVLRNEISPLRNRLRELEQFYPNSSEPEVVEEKRSLEASIAQKNKEIAARDSEYNSLQAQIQSVRDQYANKNNLVDGKTIDTRRREAASQQAAADRAIESGGTSSSSAGRSTASSGSSTRTPDLYIKSDYSVKVYETKYTYKKSKSK